ncbi:MAG: hypothetical protein AAGC53_22855 [Actinomycetota bacterium]
MTDQLLLDVDAATELHQAMTGVADQIDRDRSTIRTRIADAERVAGPAVADADEPLRSLAETLRSEADDLARRLRMVIFGGPEINAGLLALDHIAANFDIIDNQGGDADDRDGIISRNDLQWAVDHLDAETAAAARWLLDHDDVFASVDTARDNDNYLAAGGSHFSADDDSGDGKFSLDDVNSYVTKLDTWATLLPYMATVDVAAKGGEHDGVMSKDDFEAFLNDYDLPPDVRQAAQQVIDDHAFHDTGGGLVSWGTLIDVASFIPVVGDVLDGAMALYYLSQGRWADAAMSGIGLIPIPGVSGGSVRATRELAEEAAESAASKALRETAEGSPRGLSNLGGVIEQTATNSAGGRVFTSTGPISRADFRGIVQGGMMRGDDVHIVTGAHGLPDGSIIPDAEMFADDVAAFGRMPDVYVHDLPAMSPAQVHTVMESPGVVVGGFCNSGVCLEALRGGA